MIASLHVTRKEDCPPALVSGIDTHSSTQGEFHFILPSAPLDQ
jgi:hypothetical protein